MIAQLALVLLAVGIHAAPTVTVSQPKATIIGSSKNGVDSFNGIPFAQPPVGSLRLKAPLPIQTALGTIDGTKPAVECPQRGASPRASENCLTLSIQRPSTATSSSSLPVIFWIFGGGFVAGSTNKEDATNIIHKSMSLGSPVMYVAVNYRLSAFGWLAGREVLLDGASNLGLLDQRLGLEWVADNIAHFGGDPSKVSLWGESAGSISVFDQLALYKGNHTYKGKPLFRGAIMNSGSILPAKPVDGTKGQAVYDAIVNVGGCDGYADTLNCLRDLPYDKFKAASDSVPDANGYESTAQSYFPRPDGKVLAESPEILVKKNQYAKVPFIVGDQEDEGTKFAMAQSNLTNTQDVIDYFSTVFFPQTKRSTVAKLVTSYPNRPAAGSPFRTGKKNEIYPEYKRLAAIIGDLTFTLTRRIFLSDAARVNPTVPSWSYLGSEDHGKPVIGTAHASNVGPEYSHASDLYASSIQTYFLSFFVTLDPNSLSKKYKHWPRWSENHDLLWFKRKTNGILKDDFRSASYNVLSDDIAKFHI